MHHSPIRALLAPAAVLSALLLSACGSSSNAAAVGQSNFVVYEDNFVDDARWGRTVNGQLQLSACMTSPRCDGDNASLLPPFPQFNPQASFAAEFTFNAWSFSGKGTASLELGLGDKLFTIDLTVLRQTFAAPSKLRLVHDETNGTKLFLNKQEVIGTHVRTDVRTFDGSIALGFTAAACSLDTFACATIIVSRVMILDNPQ